MSVRNIKIEKDGQRAGWNFSQERAFVENLLGQRFNFLLVFFSIFVAGAVTARDTPFLQASVLSLGAVIAFYLALAIARTQLKLDLLLEVLFEDPSHPATVVNVKAKGTSRRRLIGYVLPRICFGALTLWAAFCWVSIVIHSRGQKVASCETANQCSHIPAVPPQSARR
jgi:hypothetical protein